MTNFIRRLAGAVLVLVSIPFQLLGRNLYKFGYAVAGKTPERPLTEIEQVKRRHHFGS